MIDFISKNLNLIYWGGGFFGLVVIFFIFKSNKKIILYPELIPYPMHYKNVRAVLSDKMWKELAKSVYKSSNYKCDICGFKGALECHEVWNFDNRRFIQKLVGLTTLCHRCHQVKHIGLARKMGYFMNAIRHMAKVNGISNRKAKRLVGYAEVEVKKHREEYDLDLTYLNEYVDILKRRFSNRENDN
jgi:hypothetical protein